ncbi:hypothetical protein A167_00641 [Alcanivorax sp. S71-1-4]|jgi:hypothetical protein|uniref:hypothetical protein n=1 Tax=Alcanivorax sp. S71-1-4 TaxID=1177159 RepID=UPI001359072F|nr:hypothetical protein [Alcanivorax sp. S71-1-4]KAF0810762.1 hypothetical protein A167_00641 [Alcanivorax sp. S71-1-4]
MLKRLTPLSLLLLASLSGTAQAVDCDAPLHLPERPHLEQYQDYSAFIADIMTFKRMEADQLEHRRLCPTLYGDTAPGMATHQEDLVDAVQAASHRQPFDYQRHATWYNRSTSKSFVLSRLDGNEMAAERLQAGLATLQDDDARSLPLAALVRLPYTWRGDSQPEEQARQQQLIRERSVQGAYEDAAFGEQRITDMLSKHGMRFYFNRAGDLLFAQGNVYYRAAAGCEQNCLLPD